MLHVPKKDICVLQKTQMWSFLNVNKNGGLLGKLVNVDQPINAELYWGFEDEDVPRCVFPCTPSEHMQSLVNSF